MGGRRSDVAGPVSWGGGALKVDADTEWQLRGACRGHDSDIWFDQDDASVAQAKAICRTCPVVDSCRQYGWNERYGTWGSMSVAERKRVKRKRRLMAQRERSA